MELRRPELADKEAILEMIAEYKEQELLMNGVFQLFCLLPLQMIVH